ncbi:MAG: hypothetical protein ACRC92_20115 [Peptostreptococcaceae bacterium]
MVGQLTTDKHFNVDITYEDKKIVANRDKGVIIKKLTLSNCTAAFLDDVMFEILGAEKVKFVDDEKTEYNVSSTDVFFLHQFGKINIDIVLKRVDVNVQ